ncbi:DUF1501 domain-containing protein [Paeniroseomonas aquatica]|uniref:DUF1501 domain-containing protein n=1 Tax=Paeniroseomonas aquatica TaxID=373043 RepID=A0ABT8A9V8_9PROT|nr:DUF1501 domain-containing protein [Paeniroseomonas aquatica]MDN3566435.1 DUF1501 domain-containing protein [Paeniroseomonas aquatica]
MAFHLGRRHLLRAGLATAALPGLRRLAFAEEPAAARPLLVLVNLRGGMDGLHALSPADDADFVDLRADALRTAASGPRAGHRLEASSAIDFRLHPEAAPLFEIWRDGRMAIWPAAGVPQATRSHFEAQAMMGLGLALRADPGGATGWLAAWAAGAAEAPVTALSAQGGLAPELRGARQGLGIASLADGLAPPGGPFGATMLEALHRDDPGDGPGDGHGLAARSGREALAGLRSIDILLPRDAAGRPQVQPAAAYAPAREFGRALAVVAQVAALNPALVAATVDLGGWDTHEGQPGRLADRMRVLAQGLGAFDAEIAGLPCRCTVLVVSEFGRRLRSNRSLGTDHGRAGVMLAFGTRGFGLGRHFGAWPGLAPDLLDEGVDLRVATDYRDVVRSVVADLAPTLPPPFVRS